MKHIVVEDLGFKIIRKLSEIETHNLGIYIADKLTSKFTYLQYDVIVERLTNCSIYVAKIPERYSSANYIYQNFSIYISENTNIEVPDIYFLHEIMHYLQDSRHRNRDLHKMGLCEFRTLKVSGLALNEAVIQYVVSRINDEKTEEMNCFGIKLNTYNKTYYPILSNLLLQINHIFDESYLIKSLFRNGPSFKKAFCELCHNDFAYKALKENLDIMLGCRDVVIDNSIKLKNNTLNNKEIDTIKKISQKSVDRIQKSFFYIQNLLIKHYFQAMLRNIGYRMDAEEFPLRVKEYEKYIGTLPTHPEYCKYLKYSEYYLKIWNKKYSK